MVIVTLIDADENSSDYSIILDVKCPEDWESSPYDECFVFEEPLIDEDEIEEEVVEGITLGDDAAVFIVTDTAAVEELINSIEEVAEQDVEFDETLIPQGSVTEITPEMEESLTQEEIQEIQFVNNYAV